MGCKESNQTNKQTASDKLSARKIRIFQYFIFCEGSDFIWDFGKLPFPTHLGKYFIKIGKRAKIHEIGKMKTIFGLGMTPIYGLKNGQIKSLEELKFHAQPS